MAQTFTDYLRLLMPPALLGPWGTKWVDVVGGLMDYTVQLAQEAADAALIDYAPEDAVPFHGIERQIEPISPAENIASWRLRVADAWAFWTASAKDDIRDHLRLYMEEPNLFIADVAGDGWLTGGGFFGWDNDVENWQRFWVVVVHPHRWHELEVGPDLIIGPQLTVGSSMTADEIQRLRHHAKKKVGHMEPMELILSFEPGYSFESIVNDHENQSSFNHIRVPLLAPHVGYPGCDTVGPSLIVGEMLA